MHRKGEAPSKAKRTAAEEKRKQLDVTPYVKHLEKEIPITSLLIDTDKTRGQIRSIDLNRVAEIEAGVRLTIDTMEVKSCVVWEADTVGMHPVPLCPPARAHVRAPCAHTDTRAPARAPPCSV
jgi:hypothetical protein